jgi:large subunit ribosomal protein L10Ae
MSASKLSVSSVRSSIAQILTESSGEKKRNFVRTLPLPPALRDARADQRCS